MHIQPEKAYNCVRRYVCKTKKIKKHSESRCGAMKSQPTQTYADNQNKYASKVFCTYTLE